MSNSKRSSSAGETALLSDQEVYEPEARLKFGSATARQPYHLGTMGRLFYSGGCWVVRRQKALVPPGLVTFTVLPPVVAVSAVPLT